MDTPHTTTTQSRISTFRAAISKTYRQKQLDRDFQAWVNNRTSTYGNARRITQCLAVGR